MVLPPHAVPTRLVLTPEEQTAYRQLADALLQNALREYDAFCVDNPARRVGALDWKLVKAQDGISVYKECRPTTTRKDAPFVPRLLTADGRYERVDSNISVPQILVTGSMRGTVEDAVHGAFVDGPERHATRGFSIHDKSSNFRLLAQLDAPTDEDPYRFCGIAWTEMGGAGVPFVKRRDLLSLVTSGLFKRADGEQIGYYIIHSISHAQLKPLTEFKMLRAKSSFSYLFRQQNVQGLTGGVGSQVETFQKGFFAPLGDVPERGVVSAVVRTLIAPTRLVDAGYNRKLSFMLQHSPPARRPSVDDGECDDDNDQGCAGGCSRRRSDSFFSSSGLGSSGGPLRKLAQQNQSQGVCVVCKLNVCNTCKVVKKLVVEAHGYDVVVKSLGFCLVCVNKAKMLSAPLLARQELAEKNQTTVKPPVAGGVSLTPSRLHTEKPQLERNTSTSSAGSAGSGVSARSPMTEQPRTVPRAPMMEQPRVARRMPMPEQPRLQRKTSWDVTAELSRQLISTVRSPQMDKPRGERKTSWVGSSKGSFSSDEGSGRMRSPLPPKQSQSQSQSQSPLPPNHTQSQSLPPSQASKYAPDRKASWVNVPETTERRRPPPPGKPSFPAWQPASRRESTAPPLNAGNSSISQVPTQAAEAAAGSRPRRRIDERVAIEDIALRGILL